MSGNTPPPEPLPEEETIDYNPRAAKVARWQDQCFLMDARETLSRVSKKVVGYENIIVFDKKADDVIKYFSGLPDADIFFKLNTAQMALLVPTVRFWVVNYDRSDKPGPTGDHTHEYARSRELFLDDHTSPAQIKRIEEHMRGAGRAYGIGLDSFEYEFDGGDFATTEKSIKVHTEFLMTSFDALVKRQLGKNSARWLDILLRSPKKVPKDLEDEYEKGGGSDIITACRAPRAKRDAARMESELISNPAYRRIKARVGWAATDVDALVDMFDKGVRRPTSSQMKGLLESLQLDLFLEMTNYDFNFENDGRIRLSIDYRASIEGSLREPSANIFYLLQRNIKDRQASRDRKIRSLQRKKTSVKENVSMSVGSSGDLDDPDVQNDAPGTNTVQARLNQLDKDIQETNDAYTDLIEIWKYKHYSEFLKTMVSQRKIYQISLDTEALLTWRGFPDMESGRQAGIERGKNEKTSKDYASARQKAGTKETNDPSAEKILAEMRATGNNGSSPAAAAATPREAEANDTSVACESRALKKDVNTMTGKARGIPGGGMKREKTLLDHLVNPFMPDKKKENTTPTDSRCSDYPRPRYVLNQPFHDIHYMYLGDIIDTIMGIYHENGRLAGLTEDDLNIRVVLTDIVAGYRNKTTKDKGVQPDKSKPIRLNLADLPIALDEFNAFFRRKVISPRLSQYFVIDFIKDLMTDLVYRALGDACWAGRKTPIPQITYTVFEASRSNRKEPWIRKTPMKYDGTKQELFKRRKTLAGLPKPDPLKSTDVGPDKVMHYFILHGSAHVTADKRVNRRRDEKNGIYHLGLGLNRGILKEVKFISNKLLHANTARVLNDGAAGIDQLFNKFDADVELYGCPLFRNGQYIFIDPSTMGVNSEVSRALGMGGYYNIYKVKGRLGRNGYTTSLKCKFNSSGICDYERDYGNVEDAEEPDDYNVPVAIVEPEHAANFSGDETAFLAESGQLAGGSKPQNTQLDKDRVTAHATYKTLNRKTAAEKYGGDEGAVTYEERKENFNKAGFPELMERDKAVKAGQTDPGASTGSTALSGFSSPGQGASGQNSAPPGFGAGPIAPGLK